ncbi:MAG: ABC transporter substrate-binding protein [Phenylobacterium sp.]|uniref:ABC transporter substrate-binding protein n=1 Tax=Phenylobacterium sp. TaxID=1871053 RepID=UPI001A37ADFE|nr:ABC transporter substrate-binding protein [Phenylobacterium sp.]MBL8556918.1 ABC transporter substrate-binding protein [Phenylobacterium sp.]
MKVIAFAGAANWPIWAGLEAGTFASEGLDVSFALTPNSRQMARDLYDGQAHIAFTSIDNVVAYVEGQGEEPLAGVPDFVAFLGMDDGLLSVVTQPDLPDAEPLTGRRASVDAPTTGFAFVLYELLARAGLGTPTIAGVGGGAARLEALLERKHDATLLNAPLDMIAESHGCIRRVRATDVLGAYQGIVAAARRRWLKENGPLASAFIRGLLEALAWLSDPANAPAAKALLCARMPMLGAEVADRAYDLLVTDGGIRRDLSVDLAGVATVLDLRRRHGPSSAPLADPAAYVDTTLLRALGQATRRPGPGPA